MAQHRLPESACDGGPGTGDDNAAVFCPSVCAWRHRLPMRADLTKKEGRPAFTQNCAREARNESTYVCKKFAVNGREVGDD
jgi:hypothetical protein